MSEKVLRSALRWLAKLRNELQREKLGTGRSRAERHECVMSVKLKKIRCCVKMKEASKKRKYEIIIETEK